MWLLIPGQYILLFVLACIIDGPWWAVCRLLSICFLNFFGMTICLPNRAIWLFTVKRSLTSQYPQILGGIWCLVLGKPVLTVVARSWYCSSDRHSLTSIGYVMQCGWSDELMLVLLMSAKEISQMAFKASSMASMSLMFSTDGSVAIVVVVNVDGIVDCVEFQEFAYAALCHFPGQYWWVNWYCSVFSFSLSTLGLVIVLKSLIKKCSIKWHSNLYSLKQTSWHYLDPKLQLKLPLLSVHNSSMCVLWIWTQQIQDASHQGNMLGLYL